MYSATDLSNTELLYAGNVDFNKSPHDKFIAESAKYAGIAVKKATADILPHIAGCPTLWMLDGKKLVFDWQDWQDFCQAEVHKDKPYFKSHHLTKGYEMKNTYPNVPIMIYPAGCISKYYTLRDNFKYKCITNKINNKQIPYGRATKRRTSVKNLLKSSFNIVDICGKDSVEVFWKSHENCLSAVCVPGATNNMLDRGHLELIGLGVCTISPYIPTTLPYDQSLIPGIHYIQCRDDYTDLVKILKWCINNRKECEIIGNNARSLFDKYLTPHKQWIWINQKTIEFYENE